MFTYIIWGVILVSLFLLRSRIAGFFTASIVFMVMVFVAIFILDFYSVWDPNGQGLVNLHLYNQTVEDPAKTASEVGEMVTDAGSEVTKGISETGSTLDEQFGVTETKDGVTTDEGGKWLSTTTESDSKVEEESSKSESATSIEKETSTTTKETTESETKTSSFLSKFGFGEDAKETTLTGKLVVTYVELETSLKELSLTEQDKDLLRALSPFNKGTIEGSKFKATNDETKVTITWTK